MLLLDKFIMNGEVLEICDLFSRTKIGEIISNLSAKQNITDNALATNAKTIVGAINEINSDLTDLTTLSDKNCTFTNIDSRSRYRCNIIPISKNLGLCVLKATLIPTNTTISYTIPKSAYGADINAVMYGLFGTENAAIDLGQGGAAGEMFTGTRSGLTTNEPYVIDTCYLVSIDKSLINRKLLL